jgi:hypothetical protein
MRGHYARQTATKELMLLVETGLAVGFASKGGKLEKITDNITGKIITRVC